MRIEFNNIFARVNASPKEEAWLDRYLTFETNETRYSGFPIQLYNRFSSTFPAGLLPLVVKAATEAGMTVHNVIDVRPPHVEPDPTTDLDWLRSYQREAYDRAITKEHGIIHHPTGSGKSEIAIALVKSINCKWLFLVHRTTLVMQAAERYQLRTGDTAGLVCDGNWDDTHRLTCATFQTLHVAIKNKRPLVKKFLESIQGVIFDESHAIAAKTFYKVAMSLPNAYWRIGLSGTPLARMDKKSIYAIGAIGPVIHRLKPEVLIQEGVIARPRIIVTPISAPAGGSNFAEAYKSGIVLCEKRNRAIIRDIETAEKPCIVFVKLIEHGKILKDMCRLAGWEARFVQGADTTKHRQSIITSTARGAVDVLISTVVLQEGVDIPECMSIVNAAGGRSIIALLQKIGRGMRSKDSRGNIVKTEFDVYEYNDIGNRWLMIQSQQRFNTYRKEGYKVVTRQEIAPFG